MNPVFPFPLKTDTNKLNIHSCGILPSNKVSLNVAVKDLRQGFKTISDYFPTFHVICCTLLRHQFSALLAAPP